jgi:NTP pyrophosphatase (non-canonical NTP hydrolase)
MPRETGKSISDWATETFGQSGSDSRVAARALEEMAELLRKTTAGEAGQAVADECADVVIVLARLAWRNGADIFEAVDRKMQINRQRRWKLDGSGHGYHVRDRVAEDFRHVDEGSET